MTRLGHIAEVRDALEQSFDGGGLVLHETELSERFFDLSSGIAGELFQQFSNYGQRLALVIPDPGNHNARLAELAYEHRSHPLIRFFDDETAARAWLVEED
ncbi:MAG: DUF4180 domain-containing protein [Gammaproteobacteria bacterium]